MGKCADCGGDSKEYKRCYPCKQKADEKYEKETDEEQPVQTNLKSVFDDRKTLMMECKEAVREIYGELTPDHLACVNTLFIEVCRSRRRN